MEAMTGELRNRVSASREPQGKPYAMVGICLADIDFFVERSTLPPAQIPQAKAGARGAIIELLTNHATILHGPTVPYTCVNRGGTCGRDDWRPREPPVPPRRAT